MTFASLFSSENYHLQNLFRASEKYVSTILAKAVNILSSCYKLFEQHKDLVCVFSFHTKSVYSLHSLNCGDFMCPWLHS